MSNITRPAIDCSAQMGGEDADSALLPHFRALKRVFVESGEFLPCEVVERLAFVLRVDGEIQQFNIVGSDKIELNRKERYISVDIGVPIEHWKDRSDREIAEYLIVSMRQGLGQILARLRLQRIQCDEPTIRALFEAGAQRYLAAMGS